MTGPIVSIQGRLIPVDGSEGSVLLLMVGWKSRTMQGFFVFVFKLGS